MRLTNLLAGGLFLMTTALTAQNADNTQTRAFSFGVKGGVNFATVNGSDDFNSPDPRTSFHVGVVGELPIHDMVSIQAEALFSGQGFEYDFEGPDGDKAEFQLGYINVPVLAKIYLFKGFSVEAGPQFSFLVNDEIDFNPNSNDGDLDLTEFGFDEPETFDFGVAAGLTFQTEMGLFATGRYIYGTKEIFNNTDLRNSVFQLGLGYKF